MLRLLTAAARVLAVRRERPSDQGHVPDHDPAGGRASRAVGLRPPRTRHQRGRSVRNRHDARARRQPVSLRRARNRAAHQREIVAGLTGMALLLAVVFGVALAGRRLDAGAPLRPRVSFRRRWPSAWRGDDLRPDRIAARVVAPSRARRRVPRVLARPDAASGRRHGDHAERRVRRRRTSGRQRLGRRRHRGDAAHLANSRMRRATRPRDLRAGRALQPAADRRRRCRCSSSDPATDGSSRARFRPRRSDSTASRSSCR